MISLPWFAFFFQNTVTWRLNGPANVVHDRYQTCTGHKRGWNILKGNVLDVSILAQTNSYIQLLLTEPFVSLWCMKLRIHLRSSRLPSLLMEGWVGIMVSTMSKGLSTKMITQCVTWHASIWHSWALWVITMTSHLVVILIWNLILMRLEEHARYCRNTMGNIISHWRSRQAVELWSVEICNAYLEHSRRLWKL